jgi:HSP20 family molecular chaperone IbpA
MPAFNHPFIILFKVGVVLSFSSTAQCLILSKLPKGIPACDFHETKESYCLSLELPGISKENIDISISGDNLIVKGEITCEN